MLLLFFPDRRFPLFSQTGRGVSSLRYVPHGFACKTHEGEDEKEKGKGFSPVVVISLSLIELVVGFLAVNIASTYTILFGLFLYVLFDQVAVVPASVFCWT